MEFKSLSDAIRSGTAKDVERLLQSGADPNGFGNNFSGSTLIHAAVERGDCEMLQLLIRYGGDPERADLDTETTPLQSAFASGQEDIVRVLLDAGCRR